MDEHMQHMQESWEWQAGTGPVIGAALHAGHALRPELRPYLALGEADRCREEDPYTDEWTRCCDGRLIVHRSRFEVDLNRPREEAVYRAPADSWGLRVWNRPLPADMVARSRAEHDRFYSELDIFLTRQFDRYGPFVILDLHSYNYRRGGPDVCPAPQAGNPDLNVGTGSLDKRRWGPVVDRFIHDFKTVRVMGRQLDVRENVNFKGRYLAAYVHRKFADRGCVLALEFKKTFMDEWTGVANLSAVMEIGEALRHSLSGVRETLGDFDKAGGCHA